MGVQKPLQSTVQWAENKEKLQMAIKKHQNLSPMPFKVH